MKVFSSGSVRLERMENDGTAKSMCMSGGGGSLGLIVGE